MKVVRILAVVGVLALLGVTIAFTLSKNKEKMAENAKIVEKTVSTFPVAIASAKTLELNTSFNATGNFEPRKEMTFVAEMPGRITQLNFDKGAMVGEGQVMLRTDDEALQRQMKMAVISFEKAKKDLTRFESLQKANATTDVNVEQARFAFQNAEQQIEQLKEQIAKTIVKAPMSGTVVRKYVEKGSYLAPGAPIADLTDIGGLKMVIKVSDSEVLKIREGMSVQIKADVYSNASYTGVVRHIAVKSDNSKRYAVDIDLQNNGQYPLKAGMYGTALFEFNKTGSALLIPRKAIVGSLKEAQVYVVKSNNTVELRKVKTGIIKEDMVEVYEGITEGENVVTTGQVNLQNGASITILK
ncbi:MAG: efflux RND transporter periplasmic adaptor subunit [Bacteroidetes bacterium]|nr:MAG: efflux RND transporter periplasmic adaptor subunit [Bacteroidota bacterium]